MDKLNKPYLMALALKQSELLIESTHMLQDMLTSLSTSTDSDTDKLKKLSDLVTHVANMETLTKLKQFVIDNANKKNPPAGIDIKPLETLSNECWMNERMLEVPLEPPTTMHIPRWLVLPFKNYQPTLRYFRLKVLV